jgi:hypothetical protein
MPLLVELGNLFSFFYKHAGPTGLEFLVSVLPVRATASRLNRIAKNSLAKAMVEAIVGKKDYC